MTREELQALVEVVLGMHTTPDKIDTIMRGADAYALYAFAAIHYKRPLSDRSACGRAFGGRSDPLQVTCAGCKRTKGYRAAVQEVA